LVKRSPLHLEYRLHLPIEINQAIYWNRVQPLKFLRFASLRSVCFEARPLHTAPGFRVFHEGFPDHPAAGVFRH